jgi:hypothetical protein
MAEETFWADRGSYATAVSQLSTFPAKRPPDDSGGFRSSCCANGRSWRGRALYFGKLRKSCVVYVGALSDLPSAPVSEGISVRAQREGAPARA